MRIKCLNFFLVLLAISTPLQADLLKDYNGDGSVQVVAFGDSITYGVGEGVSPGQDLDFAPYPASPAGYPTRLAQLLGLPVSNQGIPGELTTQDGYLRFPSAIQSSPSDIVLILEGTNDVTVLASQEDFIVDIQQMINVAIASNRLPVILTLPPTCCNVSERRPFVKSYSELLKARASLNDIPLVDIAQMWANNCPFAESCDLYVEPEGIHPNSKGYTAIAQTISAKLLDIDIFSPDGPAQLEDALGLEQGAVVVVPNPTAE